MLTKSQWQDKQLAMAAIGEGLTRLQMWLHDETLPDDERAEAEFTVENLKLTYARLSHTTSTCGGLQKFLTTLGKTDYVAHEGELFRRRVARERAQVNDN